MSKMKTSLAGMLAIVAAMDPEHRNRIFVGLDDLKETTTRKSFKEQEGVIKMIKDYQSIISGTSKKCGIKKARIFTKITKWVNEGLLSEEDLLIK